MVTSTMAFWTTFFEASRLALRAQPRWLVSFTNYQLYFERGGPRGGFTSILLQSRSKWCPPLNDFKRELKTLKMGLRGSFLNRGQFCLLFFLQPKEVPPAGIEKECKFKVFQHQIYFTTFFIQSMHKISSRFQVSQLIHSHLFMHTGQSNYTNSLVLFFCLFS